MTTAVTQNPSSSQEAKARYFIGKDEAGKKVELDQGYTLKYKKDKNGTKKYTVKGGKQPIVLKLSYGETETLQLGTGQDKVEVRVENLDTQTKITITPDPATSFLDKAKYYGAEIVTTALCGASGLLALAEYIASGVNFVSGSLAAFSLATGILTGVNAKSKSAARRQMEEEKQR